MSFASLTPRNCPRRMLELRLRHADDFCGFALREFSRSNDAADALSQLRFSEHRLRLGDTNIGVNVARALGDFHRSILFVTQPGRVGNLLPTHSSPQRIFDLLASRALASLRMCFIKDALIAKKIVETGVAVWIGLLFSFSFAVRCVDFDFSHSCLLDEFGLRSLRSGFPPLRE